MLILVVEVHLASLVLDLSIENWEVEILVSVEIEKLEPVEDLGFHLIVQGEVEMQGLIGAATKELLVALLPVMAELMVSEGVEILLVVVRHVIYCKLLEIGFVANLVVPV